MNILTINKNNNLVNIKIEKWSNLLITKNIENNFNNILSNIKGVSKFESLSLYYEQFGLVDNDDLVETPFIQYLKNNKLDIKTQQHIGVSDKWVECYDLVLNEPKTIKIIDIFLRSLGIILTVRDLNNIRRTIKSGYYLNVNF